MTCAVCEYRRIAREALDALADALLDFGLGEKNGQQPYTERLSKLTEDFRTAYRAEHAAAA